MRSKKNNYHAAYAWLVVVINLLVILWGAYVRATGSGAGCGSHWPLCNGLVIPRPERIETLIEFIHRITSGIALVSVVGLLIWTFIKFPRKHLARVAIVYGLFFMIVEALIGASLVLLELVGENDSVVRAVTGSIHLGNTFFLVGSLSLTAWWSTIGRPIQLQFQGFTFWLSILGLAGMLILGMSGAIAALGDTLYPSGSLIEGLRQDFSATAHFLIRLRTFHPFIAITVSGYLIFFVSLVVYRKEVPLQRRLSRLLVTIIVFQLLAGIVNVYLLAPIWLQLVHLLLADVIWIILVLFSVSTLTIESAQDYKFSEKDHQFIQTII